MPGEATLVKKNKYFEKFLSLVATHDKILLVGSDNVGSAHLQNIRKSLRGNASILMGKNTMIRRCIRDNLEKHPDLEALLPHIKGNVGLVFTNDDAVSVRDKLLENRVGAPAKTGSIAPNDVTVPKGPTGLEPTQTSFLQALNIASKINKGQIEIINDVELLKVGDKVGSSEAALLQKLGIKPFSYGLSVETVYDNGSVYAAEVLDLSANDIISHFLGGVQQIAALGLEIGYPTIASLPHSFANALLNIVGVSLGTEYTIDAVKPIKEYLENPEKFAVAAPVAAAATPAAKAAEPEPEPEDDESDSDMGGGGLFGDDEEW